jgi:GAF domain-containing protein
MENEPVLRLARDLAERLEPAELDATLEQVTDAAVRLLPNVQFASITVLTPDGLRTVAPTDERLLRVDDAQFRLQEGPCFDAATETAHVICSDLRSDRRFPRYGPVAVEEGIRAQIGVRLYDAAGSQGALNLYSTRVGAFDDDSALSAFFAHQAGQAVAYAHEISSLQEALRTRTVIGEAVGLVMERFGLSDERAFAFLKRLSSHRNVKIRVIAQELVDEFNMTNTRGQA